MRFRWLGLGPLPPIPEAGRLLVHSSSNGRAIRPLSLLGRETQMDDTMKAFVERQNIAHYMDQLKTETDRVQRDTLLKLLAEEEAKKIKAPT